MKFELQILKLLASLLVTQAQPVVQNERNDGEDKAERRYDDGGKGD